MKGIDIKNNSFKTKIKNDYNLNYGFNLYKDDNSLDDYDRFFRTKNNLNAHSNLLNRK